MENHIEQEDGETLNNKLSSDKKNIHCAKTESDNPKKITIKNIFKPISKLITRNKIIFTCKGSNNIITDNDNGKNEINQNLNIENKFKCNSTLFSSYEIVSIYSLNELNFCYVINPKQIIRPFNITFKKEIQFNDKELKQNDCIYKNAICRNCGVVLGRYIVGSSIEKQNLIEKLLILSDKVDSFHIGQNNMKLINIRKYIKISTNESKDIKEFNEINEKMDDCMLDIKANIEEAKEYLKIKKYLKKTEDYVDTLTRLAKYVNYCNFKEK